VGAQPGRLLRGRRPGRHRGLRPRDARAGAFAARAAVVKGLAIPKRLPAS
jgi:hypothetical protein